MCEGAAYGKAVPSRPSLLRSASCRQSLKCFAKKLKVSSFRTSAGRRAAWEKRRAREGRQTSVASGRLRRGRFAPSKKQGCRRQPCSLSTFDSLKPMQSGFFGSRGLFPKKVLVSGCGVKPRIYTFPHVGVRGAEPREIVPPAGRGAPSNPPTPAPEPVPGVPAAYCAALP